MTAKRGKERPLDASELEHAVGLWLRLGQQQDLRAFAALFSEYGMSQLLFSVLLLGSVFAR